MANTPNSPMLLDSTGQQIVTKLNDINSKSIISEETGTQIVSKLDTIRAAIKNSGGGGGGGGTIITAEEYDASISRYTPSYGNSLAYKYGDYCTFDDTVYRCIVKSIESNSENPPEFDATKWEVIDGIYEEIQAKPGRVYTDSAQFIDLTGDIPSFNLIGKQFYYAHAEGQGHTLGDSRNYYCTGAHVEGQNNTVSNIATHAEGSNTIASGYYAHAEGYQTRAVGDNSHAEGAYSSVEGNYSHVEGYMNTIAQYSSSCHVEGQNNHINSSSVSYTHVEGYNNTLDEYANYAHVEGYNNSIYGSASHAEGYNNKITTQSSGYSHVEGYSNTVNSGYSHAEGQYNTIESPGYYSHVEGDSNSIRSNCSHAEGSRNVINYSGGYSHAEGQNNTINGYYSHAEGYNTLVGGSTSHSEGNYTKALGYASHSGGNYTIANSQYETAIGTFNESLSDGSTLMNYYASRGYSVGDRVKYNNDGNIYECIQTYTTGEEFDPEKWNIVGIYTSNYYLFSVGNGTEESNRSNAFAVKKDGTCYSGDHKIITDIQVPDPPSQDGTYTLQCTVTDGVPTYEWV